MKLDNCKSRCFCPIYAVIITLALKYVKGEICIFFKTKYELGCVNKSISHTNEIMKMYKNTNKKNPIFYIAEMV